MEAGALGPMVLEANTLPNHKTKVAMVVLAVAVVVAEGFNYRQEVRLSKRGEPEKSQGSCDRFICELSQTPWWQNLTATKKTSFRQYSCVWAKNTRSVFVAL